MLEQKLNALTLLNVSLMPKKKGKIASKVQLNIVVMIEPYGTTKHYHFLLECKNIIRHLNGTNNKILNNLHYDKTFTLLEDHYFQERLKQYQTLFTVYQLN